MMECLHTLQKVSLELRLDSDQLALDLTLATHTHNTYTHLNREYYFHILHLLPESIDS